MNGKFRPRNDFVLVRIVDLGETESGLAIPQMSAQGKEFVVEGVGPKVKDLVVGDKVLMLGARNVTYFEVPNDSKLIVIKEEHVVLVNRPYEDMSEDPGDCDPQTGSDSGPVGPGIMAKTSWSGRRPVFPREE